MSLQVKKYLFVAMPDWFFCFEIFYRVSQGKEGKLNHSSGNIQLNRYETDPYILQIFQSNTSVCLIISVFCESCEPMLCEPEIVEKFCS